MEFIKNPEKGHAEDKLRLFIIFFLTVDDISNSDLDDYEYALKGIGCNTMNLRYLRK
jgi:sec1 family domain-containing protein 1